mmetsp:Transcript_9697/g.36393  ORF Transcript_9697/g.36393 Transcript_9697/m.36393 type:complete len:496 (+) Transcript_9697:120-1607(+)
MLYKFQKLEIVGVYDIENETALSVILRRVLELALRVQRQGFHGHGHRLGLRRGLPPRALVLHLEALRADLEAVHPRDRPLGRLGAVIAHEAEALRFSRFLVHVDLGADHVATGREDRREVRVGHVVRQVVNKEIRPGRALGRPLADRRGAPAPRRPRHRAPAPTLRRTPARAAPQLRLPRRWDSLDPFLLRHVIRGRHSRRRRHLRHLRHLLPLRNWWPLRHLRHLLHFVTLHPPGSPRRRANRRSANRRSARGGALRAHGVGDLRVGEGAVRIGARHAAARARAQLRARGGIQTRAWARVGARVRAGVRVLVALLHVGRVHEVCGPRVAVVHVRHAGHAHLHAHVGRRLHVDVLHGQRIHAHALRRGILLRVHRCAVRVPLPGHGAPGLHAVPVGVGMRVGRRLRRRRPGRMVLLPLLQLHARRLPRPGVLDDQGGVCAGKGQLATQSVDGVVCRVAFVKLDEAPALRAPIRVPHDVDLLHAPIRTESTDQLII